MIFSHLADILSGRDKKKPPEQKVLPQGPYRTAGRVPSSFDASPFFSLDDLADCWRIGGVVHRGEVLTVDLAKELIDGGASKTQGEWVDYSRVARQNNQFSVGSVPLYTDTFAALNQHKDDPHYGKQIEKVRGFLKKTFYRYWISTLSRVTYPPSGQDTVTHDVGMFGEYSVNEMIVGPDGWLRRVEDGDKICNALFGSSNLQKTNTTYKWISGKDTYLWRMDSNPSKPIERAVSLGVGDVGFNLNAGGIIAYDWPALGVRVVGKNFPQEMKVITTHK